MPALDDHPQIHSLARELGIIPGPKPVAQITEYALHRVEEFVEGSQVDSLGFLLKWVANKLSMKIEFIKTDDDIDRIIDEYQDFHSTLAATLRDEFFELTTEGITLVREEHEPGFFRFLAIVDARYERGNRAYFTAWHEVSHILVHPKPATIQILRRTPTSPKEGSDPLERIVDNVAGHVAFWRPLFEPVLLESISVCGGLSFEAIERTRLIATPTASLLSTATGAIRMVANPALVITIELNLKVAEEEEINSGVMRLPFDSGPQPCPRVVSTIANSAGGGNSFAIRKKMRVPPNSVLMQAFESEIDIVLQAEEDQFWWETSQKGPLPRMPMMVHAVRRGRFVYGLFCKL